MKVFVDLTRLFKSHKIATGAKSDFIRMLDTENVVVNVNAIQLIKKHGERCINTLMLGSDICDIFRYNSAKDRDQAYAYIIERLLLRRGN